MRNDEGKNYIMSVDSFIDTFSLMDASKTICFSMEMQKREKDMWEAYFSALWEGDRVLVYRRKPLASINVVLAVVGVTGKSSSRRSWKWRVGMKSRRGTRLSVWPP